MAASTSLYRKYRSQDFDELVGQEPVVRTLKNAISSGRIAHAYLFTGPRGVGKTSAARLLARAANCLSETADKPCNNCANCLALGNDIVTDLIEIDAASNTGVDNVREIIERANFAPSVWKTKFYVIDECFRYEELVTLADGSKMPIGRLVETGWQGEVLSYNETTGQVEPRRVARHMRKKPVLPMVRVTLDNNRSIVCTLNHKFYTPDGRVHACQLVPGQFVYANYERLTQHQHSVVAGATLGDGHLSLTGSKMRARLTVNHGVRQKEYLEYKRSLLGNLVRTGPRYQHGEGTFSKTGTYHLATTSRPQIAQLHRQLYGEAGRKQLTQEFLAHIDVLGLALWYLDDGSLTTQNFTYRHKKDSGTSVYSTTRSTLSTYSFSVAEVELVQEWLKERWGIDAGIVRSAKGPTLWLTVAGTKQLHELIAAYVPPSMEYKLLPAYRGRFKPPEDDGKVGALGVSIVRSVEWVEPTEYVYNIEVEHNHNYFVRDILVANCHMLSVSAFNALLKTLEEPPPQVAFILATTEVHKVPATVASRCQRFDFRKIPLSAMTARLRYVCDQEGIEAEQAALELVARQSTGSLRDALSLLDQLRVYADEGITLKSVQDMLGTSGAEQVADFVDTMLDGDLAAGLTKINSLLDEGLDARQFNRQIVEHLRSLMLVKSGAANAETSLLDATEEMRARLNAQAARSNMADLLRWVKEFADADGAIRSSAYRQLPLEMALVSALLPPATEPAVRLPLRDRSADISAAAEQVAQVPPSRQAPQTPAVPAVQEPVLPPPIQRELGTISGNGKAQTPSKPAEEPEAHIDADEPPVDIYEASANGNARTGPEPALVEAEEGAEESPAAGNDELERLRTLWPKLCEQINARSRNMSVVFRNADLVRPFSVKGKLVVISFRDSIQRTRSQTEPYRTIIEESLDRVLGYKCIVESILFSEEESGGKPPEPFPPDVRGKQTIKEKKPSPYETSRGRAAMNIFGITKFDE